MLKGVFLIVMGALFYSCGDSGKVGYIQIQKVFNGFQYKKELEKELTAVQHRRKFIIDSLETEVKILSKRMSTDAKNPELQARLEMAKEFYYNKRADFEDDEEKMVKLYDEKIIAQLNSYVKQYGAENDFKMIYGANASGNIMYADTTLDITADVTDYINQKFVGK